MTEEEIEQKAEDILILGHNWLEKNQLTNKDIEVFYKTIISLSFDQLALMGVVKTVIK